MTFFSPEDLCVTKVSEINLFPWISIPETRSPEVIPVAQKIESTETISFNSYFFLGHLYPFFLL